MQARDPSHQPESVQAFLAGVPPFDRLPSLELAALAAGSRVALYLKDESVPLEGLAGGWLCCVQRGGLRLRGPDGGPARDDLRGQGECFGLGAVPGAGPGAREAIALEDTFLVRLPGEVFAAVCRRHPEVAAYFDDALAQAKSESRTAGLAACPEPDDGDYLFTRQVGEVASRGLVRVPRGTDLRQAARVMEAGQVGSVLVCEDSGAVIGIVTDRDLRRAVATGLPLDVTVETVMSAPVEAVVAETSCFEGLIRMTGAGIRHLLVARDGEPAGMVTASDLLLAHGRSPMALLRAIRRADDAADLEALCRNIRPMAAALAARGAAAVAVAHLLTLLAEQVLARLLGLLEKRCGPSPAPCRWLALGAAGRREMLPATGLSLAVVPDDGGDAVIARAARTYLQALLPMLGEGLGRCGLRAGRCGLYLGDPRALFDPTGFAADGDPLDHEASLEGFDARELPGCGREAPAAVREAVPGLPPPVLEAMLRAAVARPAPLGLYKGCLMERDGATAARLDVAGRGSRPLTALARLAALRFGIGATGTVARLEALARHAHLPAATVGAAVDAFGFFEGERLLALLAAGDGPGREEAALAPETISPRRRHAYKAAFAALENLRLALAGGLCAHEGAP
ncbi:MAG: putative nucleotidyltransferase substrate binding domain-containing protein [Solidesulfovibrio sp. DCME]|uniref:putative nucleotidyltransferase substrate binding domain-containing protein n=1 Tax=Solidesulfovibrio sp. DCME TaxID=3447380 RepID=UPI003D0DCC3E